MLYVNRDEQNRRFCYPTSQLILMLIILIGGRFWDFKCLIWNFLKFVKPGFTWQTKLWKMFKAKDTRTRILLEPAEVHSINSICTSSRDRQRTNWFIGAMDLLGLCTLWPELTRWWVTLSTSSLPSNVVKTSGSWGSWGKVREYVTESLEADTSFSCCMGWHVTGSTSTGLKNSQISSR